MHKCACRGVLVILKAKRNRYLCVYLLSSSVPNWRSKYLSEVKVRRIDLFYFLKPLVPDSLMFSALRNKLEMDLKGM